MNSTPTSATAGVDLDKRRHELKTDPAVFAAVLAGQKTHEIRKNDRGFAVGDELLLRETTHTGEHMALGAPLEYTGRELLRTVSHVLTGYGLQDGWCILSLAQPRVAEQADERALFEAKIRELSSGEPDFNSAAAMWAWAAWQARAALTQQAAPEAPACRQIDAIEKLGRDDPAVHAFLRLKRQNDLGWLDVLSQMVLHLAQDKAALTQRLIEAERNRAPAPATPAAPCKHAQMLSNLLARIHRDGGHRETEIGTEAAVAEADLIVANLNAATVAPQGDITDQPSAGQVDERALLSLPGCLADRLYEAIDIAYDRAEHAGSTSRMKKWADTEADLRAALARAPLPAQAVAQGIYVASRASVPARPQMWQSLHAQGWPITSTWIDEAGEGETGDFRELWQRIHDEIESSRGVILYAEESDFPLKGAFIECGMAIGMGKPVAVVLKFPLIDRSMRPLGSWGNHPLVKICQSLDQARRYVESFAAPAQAVDVARDAAQWSKEPPTEQADYWHWDGDEDHAPMIYHVMWSGTAKKCFLSIGQYDITSAIWCDEFGGWWLKIEQPSIRDVGQSHTNTSGGSDA